MVSMAEDWGVGWQPPCVPMLGVDLDSRLGLVAGLIVRLLRGSVSRMPAETLCKPSAAPFDLMRVSSRSESAATSSGSFAAASSESVPVTVLSRGVPPGHGEIPATATRVNLKARGLHCCPRMIFVATGALQHTGLQRRFLCDSRGCFVGLERRRWSFGSRRLSDGSPEASPARHTPSHPNSGRVWSNCMPECFGS